MRLSNDNVVAAQAPYGIHLLEADHIYGHKAQQSSIEMLGRTSYSTTRQKEACVGRRHSLSVQHLVGSQNRPCG